MILSGRTHDRKVVPGHSQKGNEHDGDDDERSALVFHEMMSSKEQAKGNSCLRIKIFSSCTNIAEVKMAVMLVKTPL